MLTSLVLGKPATALCAVPLPILLNGSLQRRNTQDSSEDQIPELAEFRAVNFEDSAATPGAFQT